MSPLSQLVQISFGFPFRGRIPHFPDGDARVIQMKDVDEPDIVYWDQLINTKLTGRRQPDWLQTGDVIFLLRGNWNFAVYIDEVPFPTVISPHFFLLRVKDHGHILPKFLAWQINQSPAQKYLNASAEGSVQRSIRKGVLEHLPIVVPPIKKQKIVVNLAEAAKSEAEAYRRLIKNREQVISSVASKILNPNAQGAY